MSLPNWRAVGYSVQGARHIQHEEPCQDAFHIRRHQEHPIIAIATADGHGDPKHANSDEGAALAVNIATRLLLEAGASLMLEPTTQPETIRDHLYRHLPKRIAYEWNKTIKIHNKMNRDGAWDEILIRYGTTVMGAVFSPYFALYLQLGDGDILVSDDTEEGPRFVFSQSEDLYGSMTHSLCQPNADIHTQVHCERLVNPSMVILSTDGIRDCLEDEAAMKRIPAWISRKMKTEGIEALDTILPEWLTQLSARGNGDDATIAFVTWPSAEGESTDANA
ncbi:MAG: PP2C family serine/threonine-protein phosphatase [Myxococcota bacterium]